MLWHSFASCLWRAFYHPFVLPVNSRDMTAEIDDWIPSLLLLCFLTFIHFLFWRFQTHLLFSEAFAFFYSYLLSLFFFSLRYFLFNSKFFSHIFLPPQPEVNCISLPFPQLFQVRTHLVTRSVRVKCAVWVVKETHRRTGHFLEI